LARYDQTTEGIQIFFLSTCFTYSSLHPTWIQGLLNCSEYLSCWSGIQCWLYQPFSDCSFNHCFLWLHLQKP